MSNPQWHWRPDNFGKFIGQEPLKRWLEIELEASKKQDRPIGNMLWFGPGGLGKTTMLQLIATVRDVNLILLMGPNVNEQVLGDAFGANPNVPETDMVDGKGWERRSEGLKVHFVRDPSEKQRPTIVAIDEADGMSREGFETIYKIMEPDAEGNRILWAKIPGMSQPQKYWVPPCTIIMITNHENLIPAPAKRDGRVRFRYEFRLYDIAELSKIIWQYADALDVTIEDGAVMDIADRSNGVASTARDFLLDALSLIEVRGVEKKITRALVDEALKIRQVDALGLYPYQREYLAALESCPGGKMSLPSLVAHTGKSSKLIMESVEPLLIRKGLIRIVPGGRIITPNGRQHVRDASGNVTAKGKFSRALT